MTDFSINNSDGRWHIRINGQDITRCVADGGVRIDCREFPLRPIVELRIIADKLDVDLADSALTVEVLAA